jgi:hypothetical protein
MTQEEKQLLLEDLSARISYGVKIEYNGKIYSLSRPYPNFMHIINGEGEEMPSINKCKPYLRPMSSMTNEELNEFRAFHCLYDWHPEFYAQMCNLPNIINMINWLNKKQFDYRGLIPMGLALVALEGMYKI